MGLFDDVGRADVLSALEEHDQLGGEEFRLRYGFGRPHDFVLWHDGRIYDARSVLGVARKYAGGTPATDEDFRSGAGAAALLTELGFHVTSTDAYAGFGGPVTGSWREADELGDEAAQAAWATAARDVLLQAARRYRAVVVDDELATQVTYRTGVRSDRAASDWLGDVLRRVCADCVARDEPLLAALCVTGEGRAVASYAGAVAGATGFAPPDAGDHAARQRLECYRHFRAVGLPADGGTAARTTTKAAPRARSRTTGAGTSAARPARSRAAPKPVPPVVATCPSCYMALPVTGVCDTCD